MNKRCSNVGDGIYSMEHEAFPNGSVKRSQETLMTHFPHCNLPPEVADSWKYTQTWDADQNEVAHTGGGQVSLFLTHPEKNYKEHRAMRADAKKCNTQKEFNKKFKLNDPEVGTALFM